MSPAILDITLIHSTFSTPGL